MNELLKTESIPIRRTAEGAILIGGTRVTLESLLYCYYEGASPETIQEAYPALSLPDIYLVLGYCLRNPQEVQAYMDQHKELTRTAREKFSEKNLELKARLLARKKQLLQQSA